MSIWHDSPRHHRDTRGLRGDHLCFPRDRCPGDVCPRTERLPRQALRLPDLPPADPDAADRVWHPIGDGAPPVRPRRQPLRGHPRALGPVRHPDDDSLHRADRSRHRASRPGVGCQPACHLPRDAHAAAAMHPRGRHPRPDRRHVRATFLTAVPNSQTHDAAQFEPRSSAAFLPQQSEDLGLGREEIVPWQLGAGL